MAVTKIGSLWIEGGKMNITLAFLATQKAEQEEAATQSQRDEKQQEEEEQEEAFVGATAWTIARSHRPGLWDAASNGWSLVVPKAIVDGCGIDR